MSPDTPIPPHRLKKETERLIEDAEVEMRIHRFDLKVQAADPITKTLKVSGNYADFLLAKKEVAKKGWTLEKENQAP
jgi:hypothetical protein